MHNSNNGVQRSVSPVLAFFDTNAEEHHHYLAEGDDVMWDAPPGSVPLTGKPVAPDGYEVAGIDVIVRLRKIGAAQNETHSGGARP